jgi:hypothetical protein
MCGTHDFEASMSDTVTKTNVTDNVTPLRRPVTRKASRQRNAERQRRYRQRKAGKAVAPVALVAETAEIAPASMYTAPPSLRANDPPKTLLPQQLPELVDIARLPVSSVTAGSGIVARSWSAIGRAGVGLAIISTGAFIAFTSMCVPTVGSATH